MYIMNGTNSAGYAPSQCKSHVLDLSNRKRLNKENVDLEKV